MAQRLASAVAAQRTDADYARFRTSFLEHEQEADQSDLSAEVLERLSAAFWAFGAERKPGEIKVRLRSEDGTGPERRFSVLEIIAEDRPFLVASVLAELGAFDLAISWVGHPIVAVERDDPGQRVRLVATRQEVRALAEALPGVVRESMMQVAFEREADDATAQVLDGRVRKVLADVAVVVDDWKAMLGRLDQSVAELGTSAAIATGDAAEEISESIAFLNWLKDSHFILMGVRDYRRVDTKDGVELEIEAGSGLGVLRDPSVRILRREGNNEAITPAVAEFLSGPTPLIITKANFRSTVQRRVFMDYIGVKRFGPSGEVIGERRILGLFTSAAYNRLPEDIPILRRKIRLVLDRANFASTSYNYNAIVNILETYPRDELFQIDADDLHNISTGIMRLTARPRTRLFVRWDKFDRFVSALVFVPRDRYTSELRERIGSILKDAFDGRVSAFYPLLGDGTLVRVHFIIGRNATPRPEVDTDDVEARIVMAARSWRDGLHEALVETRGEDASHQALAWFGDAFTVAYREQFNPQEALADIAHVERLGPHPDVGIMAYRRHGDADACLRVKLYRRGEPITLSKSLPIFEHLGLSVINEFSYPVTLGKETVHLHDLALTHPKGEAIDLDALESLIESAFPAIWHGDAQDDGFNRLIIEAKLPWREVAILRALARYLVQTGSSLSQPYMEETLATNAGISRMLLDLFRTRFDPYESEDRAGKAEPAQAEILKALEAVQSLDQDRILRRFLNLVASILRTNYYQRAEDGTARPTIAFKLDSKQLEGLPEPTPHVEIFVYSPRFEAVHLRFGRVARGGIRWSDRREDFRTEVLGLVKAQYVKNAVIVPVGAKGGFVPKRLTSDMSREAIQAEGVACYKLFMSTLLELTDNLDIKEPNAPPTRPPATVCADGPDPYLVVAADKGTATFSDIANGIALEKRFWLGDAFASGGSNGYDHKAMGITAKGAWEAVKRHVREMGIDIQTTPFSVIGVGDMSGDVFGNGMLLSHQIKLQAAFDHRDIFLDPEPDTAASFNERQRLFNLPRSSWQDYDKTLISKGGGIFSRKLKSIPLSPEVRAAFGIKDVALAPADLIRVLLTAKTDLLWFGGIGTYIKAKRERNADVGDQANDALRVDGEDVRAKVVGEGANLGCTQRGRVAFALSGGRVNTDAIDNSAGVDCSDHEVNIKILLDSAVAQNELAPDARSKLLKAMTDDVAAHVLLDNYAQTLALSLAEATAKDDIDAHARFIRLLEREGRLKREVENLPSEDEIAERKAADAGLTRPEMAVLLAYCKLKAFDDLVASDVPDESAVAADLIGYFPPVLAERFPRQLRDHRLSREIIATGLSNEIVNIGGLTYASRMRELTGADVPAVARAYVAVREVFDILGVRAKINALDGKVDANLQIQMHMALRIFIRRQTIWFLRRGEAALGDLGALTKHYKAGAATLGAKLKALTSPFLREAAEKVEAGYLEKGVPQETASALSLLEPMLAAGDLVDLALAANVGVEVAARAQALIGEATGLERLLAAALGLTSKDHWERMAVRRIVEDLTQQQSVLAMAALRSAPPGASGEVAVELWVKAHATEIKRVAAAFEELEGGTGLTAARLSLAIGHIHDLAVWAQVR